MSAGTNIYDQIFQQPGGGPLPPAAPADPSAPFFAAPPTATNALGAIQQAILKAEGGTKAKVPYEYAVRTPTKFGPDPWAARTR